jgi:hypothetical protein
VLIDPVGRALDTWRENFPYDERMPREEYDETKYLLQVELSSTRRRRDGLLQPWSPVSTRAEYD